MKFINQPAIVDYINLKSESHQTSLIHFLEKILASFCLFHLINLPIKTGFTRACSQLILIYLSPLWLLNVISLSDRHFSMTCAIDSIESSDEKSQEHKKILTDISKFCFGRLDQKNDQLASLLICQIVCRRTTTLSAAVTIETPNRVAKRRIHRKSSFHQTKSYSNSNLLLELIGVSVSKKSHYRCTQLHRHRSECQLLKTIRVFSILQNK